MVLPDCNFIPEEDNAPPNENEVILRAIKLKQNIPRPNTDRYHACTPKVRLLRPTYIIQPTFPVFSDKN
jgi:hypothetical protein